MYHCAPVKLLNKHSNRLAPTCTAGPCNCATISRGGAIPYLGPYLAIYARLLGKLKGLPGLPGALPGIPGTLHGLPGPYLASGRALHLTWPYLALPLTIRKSNE